MCAEKFLNEHLLQNHFEKQHREMIEEPTKNCTDKSRQSSLLQKHNIRQHESSKSVDCSLCGLRCEDTKTFATHIWKEHSDNIEIIQCPHCEFQSDMVTMDTHIENNHVELAFLGHITSNQTALNQNFETFKRELIIPLNKIIENHNSMKQDLVTLRQNKKDSEDRIEKLEKTIDDLKTVLGEKITEKTSPRMIEPKVPQPSKKPVEHMSFKKKTKYLEKPKVLFIGDSIAHNVSMRKVEKDLNTRVKTVKAYSAVEDLKSRFPSKNFTDVTPAALKDTREDDKYTELVLGAPTVDITNMNTKYLTRDDSIEVFEQKVIISCENMFSVAQNAVLDNPELRKVVLMEHIPREDPPEVDPIGLKPRLAKLANSTLAQLVRNSGFQNKIVMGRHSLDITTPRAVYGYDHTSRYDVVNMHGSHGKEILTRSVERMMKSVIPVTTTPAQHRPLYSHVTCPQAQYQKRRQARAELSQHYSVPVNNRFTVLGN